MQHKKKEISKSLIGQAKKDKMYFYDTETGHWFTPGEIEAVHRSGMYSNPSIRWLLRSPSTLIEILESEKDDIEKRLEKIKKDINKGG